MRNLEPNEYRSLVESYAAVYDEDLKNKLEEEKEISEFYEFVESLLNEGYDLSEYSYDDLCEYYITEKTAKGEAAKAALRILWGATKEGIRKGLKIPAGKSTAREVGERGARAAGQAVGSTAKGIYDIGSGLVGTTLGTVKNIAVGASKKPIIAIPAVVGGIDYARSGKKSWTGQTLGALSGATKGKLPSATPSTQNARPRSSDPYSGVPGSLRESPDWANVPGKPWATLTLGSERKIYVPGQGWQFPATINKELAKRGKAPIKDPGQPAKPQSQESETAAERATRERNELQVVSGGKSGFASKMPKPTAQKGETAEQLSRRMDKWERSQSLAQRLTAQQKEAQRRATSEQPKPAPASAAEPEKPSEPAKPTPASTTPAPEPPKAPPAAPTTPARAPQPTRTTPAPKPSLQTGDRTKDLTTWAKSNKAMIQKVGTPQQKEILSAAEKGTAMPAPRPLSKDIEDIKGMQKASQERQKAQGVKESYDAFDLVLEYLLSQGHVDTLDEALYVMMEMSSDTIQSIVEQKCTSNKGECPPMGGGPGGYDDEITPKELKSPPKPQSEPEPEPPVLLAKSKQTNNKIKTA